MIARIPKRMLAALASLLLLAGVLATTAPRTAQAATNPAPVQTYYMSLPTTRTLEILQAIYSGATAPIESYTSIAIGADGTLVYYDHWENGYVVDIANPAPGEIYANPGNLGGVQIWGDGDTTNGTAPGFPDDLLDAGDVIILENSITMPRNSNQIRYDGGDKFAATRSVAVVRSEWADIPATLLGSAHELYPTNQWGTSYTTPVGCNTIPTTAREMFEYTAMLVMAEQDNTIVQIDADGDGSFEDSTTLHKGESHLVTSSPATTPPTCTAVKQGGNVSANKPIQAQLFVGDVRHTGTPYELRDITLVPDNRLSAEYYNPIGYSAASNNSPGPSRVWLYNPNASTIYVRCERNSGGNVDSIIAAGQAATVTVATNSGANCYAMDSTFTTKDPNGVFSGLVTMDSDQGSGSNGATWDWSATLLPLDQLSNSALVGLGLGQDPTASGTQNGNPIWVTPTCNTILYVDWNNDGVPDLIDLGSGSVPNSDQGIPINRLQSYRLYNPNPPALDNHNQTGAYIYTLTGSNNTGTGGCSFAAAWGQDPSRASAGTPGLDVGTTVLPLISPEISKGYSLIDDVDGDGFADPGDTIEYLITITNIGLNPINNYYLYDEIPEYTTYVPGTTEKETSGTGTGSWVSIPDAPDFPLDVPSATPPPPPGIVIGSLPGRVPPSIPAPYHQVRFQVTLDEITSPQDDYDEIVNCAEVNAGEQKMIACVNTPVDNVPEIEVDKTADPTSVPEPGANVTFTVKVTNTGPIKVTIDSLTDDVFGDITRDKDTPAPNTNLLIEETDCAVPFDLEVTGTDSTYECEFTAFVAGDFGDDAHVNTVTAEGEGVNGDPVEDDDDAEVTFTEAADPIIVVDKTASPTTVPEPGDVVAFTVRVTNTGPTAVTINTLNDSVFGDITRDKDTAAPNTNLLIEETDCAVPFNLAVSTPNAYYECTFEAFVGGEAGDEHENTVTATGVDENDKPVTDDDPATVDIIPAPEIDVDKTADPSVVPAPGANVTFTVRVTNTGPTDVTIDTLNDDIFGDIADSTNSAIVSTTCTVPQALASTDPDAAYECTFVAFVGGSAGQTHTNTVTAEGYDENETPVEGDDPATVDIVPVPEIDVDKTANPSVVPEPGADVIFTVRVTNTGPTDVTIDTLNDSIFGDITTDEDTPAPDTNLLIKETNCEVPQNLASTDDPDPDDFYECTFTAFVGGQAGDQHENTVTAEGYDENETPVEGDDPATVDIVPVPEIDVDKTANPSTVTEPGENVTFTVRVTNTGPTEVTIDSLTDDIFGDIADSSNSAIVSTTCVMPQTLASTDPDAAYECSFVAFVGGSAGQTHTNTVTAEGEDENGIPVEDDDPENVRILPYIILTPSYLVTRVVEGQLSGEGSKACYWITLSAQPQGNVVIDVDPDKLLKEIKIDKSRITLNASNWNNLTTSNQSNFLCVRAVEDSIDESNDQICGDKSADMTSDATPYTQECGDHKEFAEHRVNETLTTDTDYNQQSRWENRTLTHLGRPANNYLEAMILDNDVAEVRITESFAITHLDESGLPVGKACYWLTLGSQPLNPVTIAITPDNIEVATDKTSVTLDASNWNKIDASLANKTNMVCVTPIDDDEVVQPQVVNCSHSASTMLGQMDPTTPEICSSHMGSIAHSVSSADPKYNTAPFKNTNGPDFDNDQSTIDALIRDDDVVGLRFQPATLNLLAGTQERLSLTLASKPTADVHVSDETTELVFQPSSWNVPQEVTVNAPDITGATPETLFFRYSVNSEDLLFQGMNLDDEATVAVTVIPKYGVYLSRTTFQLSETGETSETYEMVLTSKPAANVRVALSTDGQLAVSPSMLEFTPDNWGESQTVRVTAVDDDVAENSSHHGRIIHTVTSDDAAYEGLAISDFIATIRDNDVAAVMTSAETLVVSEDGQHEATYDVSLNSKPTETVIVHIDGGGQVKVTPGMLTFTPENWNTPRAVLVQAIDDNIDEGVTHTTSLTHKLVSADPFYNRFESTMSVTVADDDVSGVQLSQAAMNLGINEVGTYTIVLTSRPTAGVVIDLSADGNVTAENKGCVSNDGSHNCVVFTPDNWNVPQTVSVRASGAGTINHIITSADGIYQSLNVNSVKVNSMFMLFLPMSQGN